MVKLIYSSGHFNTIILEDEKRSLIEQVENNVDSMYSSFESIINGKVRSIDAVVKKTALESLQRSLLNNFLNSIPLPDEVHGFVKGVNYRTYLLPHVRENYEKRFYLRLDIKNFFGSITTDLVKESLEEYIKVDNEEEKEQILKDINTICFYKDKLPQGAITSPVLSNITFRRADLRIRKYCRKLNVTYTRYADDMLFSFTDRLEVSEKLMGLVNVVLRDFDLSINYSKTIKTENLISLNGFVVSDELSISRKKLAKLKKVLFIVESIRTDSTEDVIMKLNNAEGPNLRLYFQNLDKLHNYLAGYRSFLLSWLPKDDSKWKKECQRTINRIEAVLGGISGVN